MKGYHDMLTPEERNAFRHIEAKAHNTWGVGGEDIMLVFKWASELGVQFSMRNFGPSEVVYVDLSIENAKAFLAELQAAITGAEEIDRAYSESQVKDDMDNSNNSGDLGML